MQQLHSYIREMMTEAAELDPIFAATQAAVNNEFEVLRAAVLPGLEGLLLDLDAAIGAAVAQAIETGFFLGSHWSKNPELVFYAPED